MYLIMRFSGIEANFLTFHIPVLQKDYLCKLNIYERNQKDKGNITITFKKLRRLSISREHLDTNYCMSSL